ncbi:dihydroorotate dehydrogenase electron transfer subunit [bacterium]|nr:dihydroorotate dehydrogenase electron transfer subunit [bacterium]
MKAAITYVRKSGLYNYISLAVPAIARKAKPGQFVEIQIKGTGAPFWRRPFSICNARENYLELLIKTVGPGTGLIANMQSGNQMDITGPFGNTFTLPGKAPVLLVGGGFGVAPLFFLANRLRRTGRDVEALIGGRTAQDLLLRHAMQRLGVKVFCSTNDGSFGTKGLITQVLQQRLDVLGGKPRLAAAGPKAMLRAVADVAKAYAVVAQVSLEEVMACGMGVCNGCVVKIAGEYKRVCKDGTIFNADEVDWDV